MKIQGRVGSFCFNVFQMLEIQHLRKNSDEEIDLFFSQVFEFGFVHGLGYSINIQHHKFMFQKWDIFK